MYALIGLLFVCLLSCQWSDAAVQRAPPRYPAYQPSTEYVYDYTSRSQLQRNLSVNVEAEVSRWCSRGRVCRSFGIK